MNDVLDDTQLEQVTAGKELLSLTKSTLRQSRLTLEAWQATAISVAHSSDKVGETARKLGNLLPG